MERSIENMENKIYEFWIKLKSDNPISNGITMPDFFIIGEPIFTEEFLIVREYDSTKKVYFNKSEIVKFWYEVSV